MIQKSNQTGSQSSEVVTSLRLSRKQHEALKALAARENRSVSGQLRHIIERLTTEERKAAA